MLPARNHGFSDVGIRDQSNGLASAILDLDKGIKKQVFGRITHGPADIVPRSLPTHSADNVTEAASASF